MALSCRLLQALHLASLGFLSSAGRRSVYSSKTGFTLAKEVKVRSAARALGATPQTSGNINQMQESRILDRPNGHLGDDTCCGGLLRPVDKRMRTFFPSSGLRSVRFSSGPRFSSGQRYHMGG